MLRRTAAVAAMTIAVALLAACGDDTDDPAAAPTPAVAAADLLGQWSAELADATADEPIPVSFTPTDVRWTRPCGELHAMWVLDDTGRLTAQVSTFDSACEPVLGRTDDGYLEPWLAGAARVEGDSSSARLVASDGTTLATLTRTGPAGDGAATATSTPAPLPAGAQPPTRDAMVRSWDVADAQRHDSWTGVTLEDDGRWSGSDGCNASGGVWALGPAGELRVLSGGTTLALCPGTTAASDFAAAHRVALDGEQLVLLDETGTELSRLARRDPPPSTTATTGP